MDSLTKKQLDSMYYPYDNREDYDDCCEASEIKCCVSDEVKLEIIKNFFFKTVPVILVVDQWGDKRGGSYAYNIIKNQFQCIRHDEDEEEDDEEDEEESGKEDEEEPIKRMRSEDRKADFRDMTFEEEEFDPSSLAGYGEDVIERVYWVWLHYRLCKQEMFSFTN